jgi:methylmalonyl-CoA decarboxylase
VALLAGVSVTLKLVEIIGVCALALDILANSSLVITLLKEEIHVLAQARPLTVETFERIQGVRRRIYDSDDYQEGIRSFFEKRKPVFQRK